MTVTLPAGVESYLKEVGFSATEMLVLRKLLEQDSLTVRELGTQTGKSTGVLDQAVKKLLGKKIVTRGTFNGQPRYSIDSMESILQWVKNDMRSRKDVMDRRQQDFESFINTIKIDRKHPNMEYFHGKEGIQKAYLKLLESGQELLTRTPVLYNIEEDPLRAFRVEFFRKRQVRKIFQRVIAPDTQLARRFQSRDPFEYRQTMLVPQLELPLSFERTVVGDTIACINFTDETACFIRYPELAASERGAFEAVWANKHHVSDSSAAVPVAVPLKTKAFSAFREFILSRKSIAALIIFALVAATLTFGLYRNNRDINMQRLKEKVMAIAATAALQFEESDIQVLRDRSDMQKNEFAKVVATLNLIRRSSADIQYAYIMRKTDTKDVLSFVADADSLFSGKPRDLNRDGKIDAADTISVPGDLYGDYFPFIAEGFEHPIATVGRDQWGNFVSGHAPILNKNGEAIAILGIDVFADDVEKLTLQSFSPVLLFAALVILFALVRFIAINRSLLAEVCVALQTHKKTLSLWLIFLVLCAMALAYGFHQYRYHQLVRVTGEKLQAIAVTAADDFDPNDLIQLHFARDMETEAYQRVFRKLNEIRSKNEGVIFAYIFRPTNQVDFFEFIADADSNFNLPKYSRYSMDEIGPITESNENVAPGVYYFDVDSLMSRAMTKPVYGVSRDQWGVNINGLAPIYYKGEPYAVLGLDFNVSE